MINMIYLLSVPPDALLDLLPIAIFLIVLFFFFRKVRGPMVKLQRQNIERHLQHMERVEQLLERIATAIERNDKP